MTYDVQIWSVRVATGKRGTKYQLRWAVAKRPRSETFRTRNLAESFRADLRAAANRGEPFDVDSGRPLSMIPNEDDVTWWEFVLTYIDVKWPVVAPNSRRSIAGALVTATMAMLSDTKTRPPDTALRSAMTLWAFNARLRAAGPPPSELAAAVTWLERNSRPLAWLEKTANARTLLDAIARTKAGDVAAATTVARKRAVVYNVLELAVEREHLQVNPLMRVKWKAPKVRDSFDPRAVINPDQARHLLTAVGSLDVEAYRHAVTTDLIVPGPPGLSGAKSRRIIGLDVRGRHLVAFFACMYYSALRPSEAIALTVDNLDLPAVDDDGDGWGWLLLSTSDADVASTWSDGGRRVARQLKHRAEDTVRPVPAPPPLVEHLRAHLEEHGTAEDGRLFRGAYGARISTVSYTQVWDAARRQALEPAVYAGPLARRPYDLRHTAVSTWLAAGVDSTQVAAWAGHSVAVLHRVYAHIISGRDSTARARMAQVLGLAPPSS